MDESLPGPSLQEPRLVERWHALVDILYLTQVTWLYLFAALYPFVGILYGVLLLAGSATAKAKRIGRVCLILGIVNTALFIVAMVVLLVLGLAGALAAAGD
jgi:hypothetical protein